MSSKVDNCLNASLSYLSQGIGYGGKFLYAVSENALKTLPSAICGAITGSAYVSSTGVAQGFAQGAVFAVITDLASGIRARVNDPSKVQNRDGVEVIKAITVIGQIALPIILFSTDTLSSSIEKTSTVIVSYATPYIPAAISNLGAHFIPKYVFVPTVTSGVIAGAASLAPKYFFATIGALQAGYRGFKQEYNRVQNVKSPPPQASTSSPAPVTPAAAESTATKIGRGARGFFDAMIGKIKVN